MRDQGRKQQSRTIISSWYFLHGSDKTGEPEEPQTQSHKKHKKHKKHIASFVGRQCACLCVVYVCFCCFYCFCLASNLHSTLLLGFRARPSFAWRECRFLLLLFAHVGRKKKNSRPWFAIKFPIENVKQGASGPAGGLAARNASLCLGFRRNSGEFRYSTELKRHNKRAGERPARHHITPARRDMHSRFCPFPCCLSASCLLCGRLPHRAPLVLPARPRADRTTLLLSRHHKHTLRGGGVHPAIRSHDRIATFAS